MRIINIAAKLICMSERLEPEKDNTLGNFCFVQFEYDDERVSKLKDIGDTLIVGLIKNYPVGITEQTLTFFHRHENDKIIDIISLSYVGSEEVLTREFAVAHATFTLATWLQEAELSDVEHTNVLLSFGSTEEHYPIRIEPENFTIEANAIRADVESLRFDEPRDFS